MDTSQDAKWSQEIATYTATAGDAAMTAILADVQKQTLPLKKLVDLLGSALTSSEDLQRSRGMALLGASINRLGTANLAIDGNSVLVVAGFLIERLQDYATQQEVLDAIRTLLLHHPIPTDKGVIKKITNAFVTREVFFFSFLLALTFLCLVSSILSGSTSNLCLSLLERLCTKLLTCCSRDTPPVRVLR
jgi:hypothetical protein